MKYIFLLFILIILVSILYSKKEDFDELEEGTLKKTPFSVNSRKIVDSIDEGILFNLRVENETNSFSEEINFNEMNGILKEIIKKNKHNVDFENILHEDFLKISNKLINLINKLFKNLDLNNIYHKDDSRKYKYKQYQILKN